MSAVVPFDFSGQQVRVIPDEHGEPWFVAVDVCAALGISNGRDAVARLDADGVGTADVIDSMGRDQVARTVNESGLYEPRPQHNAPRHHNGQVRQTLYVRQAYALDLAKAVGLVERKQLDATA